MNKTMQVIGIIILSLLMVACTIGQLVVSQSWKTKARGLELELRKVNLDRNGLNGLCKSLIEQKFAPPNYNTLDYGINLPDGMSVAIKVNYVKEHIISPRQGHELMRLHKEAIAEITHEEWTSYRDFKPPE